MWHIHTYPGGNQISIFISHINNKLLKLLKDIAAIYIYFKLKVSTTSAIYTFL